MQTPVMIVVITPSAFASPQTFLGWWWLYCIIILTAYKSTLVAMMTVPSLSENINTLEALASSSFSWGISDGFGSDFTLFQTSQVSIYKVGSDRCCICVIV